MEELFVLVHSPVVGPATWEPVAEELRNRGYAALVPDLTGITASGPPFWPNAVRAVRAGLEDVATDRRVVLVGHSNSGVLLPVIAAGIDQAPAASVFVDAAIPAMEGATDLSNDDAFFMLRALADDDGVLPPWDEWFDPQAMAEVMPDTQLRERISAQLPRLPLSYYQQSIPVPAGWDAHPVSYIQFSKGYGPEADTARQRGWRVRQLTGRHLHQVVDPSGVTEMLLQAPTLANARMSLSPS